MDTKEYDIEIHLNRKGDNYRSDCLIQILVNGEPFDTEEQMWVLGFRQWINSIGIATRAQSMRSLESALKSAGYLLSFVEQYRDFGGEEAKYDSILDIPLSTPVRVVRKYRVAPIKPIQTQYVERHEIAKLAARIIEIALSSVYNELDIARGVDEACQQIQGITARYQGAAITDPYERISKPASNRPDPSILENNLKLKVGDFVYYERLGSGFVASIEKDEIVVRFETDTRHFHMAYTKLEYVATA